jgi:RNase P protein component
MFDPKNTIFSISNKKPNNKQKLLVRNKWVMKAVKRNRRKREVKKLSIMERKRDFVE